ncbi:MAG: transporter, partial [Deltaproteobacteria bacterium]|nr:transporter [Deltaproteobacteria bacterium]
MLTLFKKWASPIAIILGVVGYRILDHLSFLIPLMLFSMIFVTYCSLSLRDIKFHRMHFILISTQIVLGLSAYFIIYRFSSITAEAMLICILAPTAISATVVAAMIGGNIATLTLYTLLGNLVTALLLPLLLPSLGISSDLPYLQSFMFILKQLFLMLIAPLIGAVILSRFFPQAYNAIRKRQIISFYIWFVSFAVVIARSVKYFLAYGEDRLQEVLFIAAGSLTACAFQYWLGRVIGKRYGERITGGQALGHKNTVLAIWIAQSYLQPLASIAPTAYILWQAMYNGYQVWRYQRTHPES